MERVLAGNQHSPEVTYLAVVGAAAGVVAAAFLLDFLVDFFFAVALIALPLFFAAGALVVGAGVCPNEIPATASESVRPRIADVSFFMMFKSVSFSRHSRFGFLSCLPLLYMTRARINPALTRC